MPAVIGACGERGAGGDSYERGEYATRFHDGSGASSIGSPSRSGWT